MELIGANPKPLAGVAGEAGTLGTLVHTAGLSPVQAPWETVVAVNLTGTARLLDAFGPLAGPGSVDFLTSDSAGYVTGCDLRVDGGTVAARLHQARPSS
jgi:NAD(P)-dependent dehydrogenase (short-subunit alcohol dehydrogenase family)